MNEFHECFARDFEHVWPELRGADVFVDDIWSDVLHWNTAPAALLDARPACVLALTPDAAATPLPRTHPSPTDERRAVFFVGSFLHTYTDACVRILQSRSEARAPYRECVVYSAISNLGHARCLASVQRQFGAKDAYTWLQDTLCAAIGLLDDGTRPFVLLSMLQVCFLAHVSCFFSRILFQSCCHRMHQCLCSTLCQRHCVPPASRLPSVHLFSQRRTASRVCFVALSLPSSSIHFCCGQHQEHRWWWSDKRLLGPPLFTPDSHARSPIRVVHWHLRPESRPVPHAPATHRVLRPDACHHH